MSVAMREESPNTTGQDTLTEDTATCNQLHRNKPPNACH